jgi:adenosylhomocysteine nucleosidase
MAAMRRAMPVERRIEIDGVSCFTGQQAGRAYWLVPTGIGPEAADMTASAVLNRHRAALAVSAGFSGALLPTAAVGDVIVATHVVSGRFDGTWVQAGGPMACDDTVRDAAHTAAAVIGSTVRSGPVVSLSTVLCRAVDKQCLSRQTGAIAVDMESAAIAEVARTHGVPFAVVRTVSDVADEDLPLDFNVFLKPWGWVRGIGAVILTPSSLAGLNRLRRQSRLAAERLTALSACWAANGFGLSRAGRT